MIVCVAEMLGYLQSVEWEHFEAGMVVRMHLEHLHFCPVTFNFHDILFLIDKQPIGYGSRVLHLFSPL